MHARYIILHGEDAQLDGNQCAALRDHIQTSTNGLYLMQQGTKASDPLLKFLPPQIQKVVSVTKRKSVVLTKVRAIANCVVDKADSKWGVRNFYW